MFVVSLWRRGSNDLIYIMGCYCIIYCSYNERLYGLFGMYWDKQFVLGSPRPKGRIGVSDLEKRLDAEIRAQELDVENFRLNNKTRSLEAKVKELESDNNLLSERFSEGDKQIQTLEARVKELENLAECRALCMKDLKNELKEYEDFDYIGYSKDLEALLIEACEAFNGMVGAIGKSRLEGYYHKRQDKIDKALEFFKENPEIKELLEG